jgi:hypothetical protein
MRRKNENTIDNFTLGMLVGAALLLCLVWAYYAH